VIAIIAILASMLLPALNKARAHAYTAKCANNQKQVGVYAQMYIGDFNGYLGKKWSGWVWSEMLAYTVGNKNSIETYICPALIPGTTSPKGKKLRDSFTAPNGYNYNYKDTTYGICEPALDGYEVQTSSSNVFLATKKIRQPSKYIFIADSCDAAGTFQLYRFSSTVTWSAVHLRHSKAANALFLDGHVKKCNREQLQDSYKQNMKIFMNGTFTNLY
jgi:prepilin-type processing-associated H-X9-DG protein